VGNINSDPMFVLGYHLQQDPCEPGVINPCVDAGHNLAPNLNMQTSTTRSDGKGDFGIVDMGYHYGPYESPSLTTDGYEVPEMLGGAIALPMNAGAHWANRSYMIFGRVSGSSPGTAFPGGLITLPFNWDMFTNIVILFVNQPMFQNFMGQLDVGEKSSATLKLPTVNGLAGIDMLFAYGLVDSNGAWDYASNAVMVKIVP